MKAHEILIEVTATSQFRYGKDYFLVHTNTPGKDGKYQGKIYDKDKKGIESLSNTDLDAMKQEFIDLTNTFQKDQLKQGLQKRKVVSASEVQKAELDFNTAFTRSIFENEVPTSIRWGSVGGQIILDVMTLQWFDEGGTEVTQGFRKLKDRAWNKKSKTKIYGITNVNPGRLEQDGFEFHGVYDLTEIESPEDDQFRRFALELIAYSNKEMSYSFPTVTVAFWYKGNKGPSDIDGDIE